MYKVAIVGGGASGLLLATELCSFEKAISGKDILILERLDRVGKKLISTGNGQGNLSNKVISEKNYYGEENFIKQAVKTIHGVNIVDYLYKIGIPTTCDEDGKIYPVSKQASAVLDILRANLLSKGVNIVCDRYVTDIYKNEDNFTLISQEKYHAKNVVLAFGGKSAKQFGTDGTSYNLAQKFGHTLTSLYPSLVQLKTDTTHIKGLNGLKERVKATAIINGKEVKSAQGDLLFTEYGVSGNVVFSLSSVICGQTNAKIKIEFLPNLDNKNLLKILSDKQKLTPYIPFNEILVGIINKKIGQKLIKDYKLNTIEKVVEKLKNFTIDVIEPLGFNNSQVTKGGINTLDIDPTTYQSKKCKNLYIVGEALNVDGDCGGYNLTFAFCSAIASAKAIKNQLIEV